MWVDKFKCIGDIIIRYEPGHAALPWTGVRFLLQLSICDKETVGVSSPGSRRLLRCGGYEDLYFIPSPASVHDGVKVAFINLYVGILEFLACAKRYLTQTVTRVCSGVPFVENSSQVVSTDSPGIRWDKLTF